MLDLSNSSRRLNKEKWEADKDHDNDFITITWKLTQKIVTSEEQKHRNCLRTLPIPAPPSDLIPQS